jgi:lipoprotein
MKKIIIILTTALIFSCSKTNDKKISDDDWKIFTKTCNTINNKIENELFLVTNDVCVIGDKELETEDDAVMKIKYSEKILKSRELRQKQKMM